LKVVEQIVGEDIIEGYPLAVYRWEQTCAAIQTFTD